MSQTPSSDRPDLTSLSKWTVICACFLGKFICLGFTFGLGVLFVEILEVFDTSRVLASLIQSLCLGVMYTGSVFISPLLVLFKPGLCLAFGGLLAFVGTLCASFANSVEVLVFTAGVMTGVGFTFVQMASYLAVVDSFKENRGLGLAIVTAGGGLGACVFPQLIPVLLEIYSWRGTLLILSAINFNACVLGLLIWQVSKPLYTTSGNGDPEFKKPSIKFTGLSLLKNGPFMIVLFLNFPYRSCTSGLVIFLVDFAKSKGFDLQMGSFLLTLVSITYVLGSFIAGMLNTVIRVQGIPFFATTLIVSGFISLGFAFVSDYRVLLALCAGIGTNFGFFDSVYPCVLYSITEPDIYPVALSVFFASQGVADICTGPVNGAIRDGTGSFTVMLYLFCVFSMSSGLGIVGLYIWTVKKIRNHKVESITVDTYM